MEIVWDLMGICGNLSGFSVKYDLSNINCKIYLWSERS